MNPALAAAERNIKNAVLKKRKIENHKETGKRLQKRIAFTRIKMPRLRKVHKLSKRRLDAMIEEATVDCYNESEETGGWFTMIEEHLKVPFETRLLGICVTVERIDLNRNDEIVAVCRRDKHRQTIPILDLPLPATPPAGAEWIEAYRRTHRGNCLGKPDSSNRRLTG